MASVDAKEGAFKLPASSLDEVFKVVQGYATVGKSASLADISKNTGMHPTAVSKNVGFLLCLGVLEGGKNKAPTELGSKLGLALMHNIPEDVESILSEIVSENEFLKNVLAAVRIRKGMDVSALRSHIAYSAGQSKTGSTTTGTGAIVELVKRSTQLKEEDGRLVVGTPMVRSPVETAAPERLTPTASIPIVEAKIAGSSPFSISIRVEVRCDARDLDNLGTKLRKVVQDFSEQEANGVGED